MKKLFWPVVAVLFIIYIVSSVTSNPQKENKPLTQEEIAQQLKLDSLGLNSLEQEDLYLAYNLVSDRVAKRLISPASATFPRILEKINHIGLNQEKGIYTISSWVDSKNQFGVQVRNKFIANIWISRDKKSHKILGLEFL